MNIFDISPIFFNNVKYIKIEVLDSATKHFGDKSELFFTYIAQGLNGQNWVAIESGTDGSPEYVTASVTSAVKPVLAQSDYRDTWFRACPDDSKIVFFHGCTISKKQYEKAKNKLDLQINRL